METHLGVGFAGAGTPTSAAGGYVYLRNRWYGPGTGRFLSQDPIGLAGGVNLYAYAGNNPVSYDDPYGLCPECVGAAVSVLEGFAIAKLTGQDYTWRDAAVDAALGAVGVGIASKLEKLNEVRRGLKGAEEELGVVYRRVNPKTGEAYIGRSKSEAAFVRRQAAHDGKLGIRHEYEIIDRTSNGTPLRAAEESAIREGGGPGRLANKRYEMNEEAYRAAGGTVSKP